MLRWFFRGASVTLVALTLFALPDHAAHAARSDGDADVPGVQDHPLVSRFPGSRLVGHFHADWDSTTFPLASDVESGTHVLKKSVTVEGAVTRQVFLGPRGVTPLEVFRNYQQAFAKAGLKTRFACNSDCGRLYSHWRFGAVRNAMQWVRDDLRAADNPRTRWDMSNAIAGDGRGFYGTIQRGGQEVHVFVYTSKAGYDETQTSATVIEIAEPKPLPADQVTVDADALGKGLASDGKVALYGIHFDTAKATIKRESDPQLAEMAKLLKAQPTLNVFLVGHTDSQGSFDANLLLSRQRAEAVRDALVSRYAIAGSRVTPYGVASVAPVASNAGEAGRALNRRVELVVR